MSDQEDLPPLTDEVPDEERESEPDHVALDEDGNPIDEEDTDAEA